MTPDVSCPHSRPRIWIRSQHSMRKRRNMFHGLKAVALEPIGLCTHGSTNDTPQLCVAQARGRLDGNLLPSSCSRFMSGPSHFATDHTATTNQGLLSIFVVLQMPLYIFLDLFPSTTNAAATPNVLNSAMAHAFMLYNAGAECWFALDMLINFCTVLSQKCFWYRVCRSCILILPWTCPT